MTNELFAYIVVIRHHEKLPNNSFATVWNDWRVICQCSGNFSPWKAFYEIINVYTRCKMESALNCRTRPLQLPGDKAGEEPCERSENFKVSV